MVNAALAAALYGPLGIAGIVIGTVAGTVVMCVAQGWSCAATSAGSRGADPRRGAALMLVAARSRWPRWPTAWYGLDEALGRSLPPRPSAVLAGIAAGLAAYAAAVWALRIPEARQIRALS